MVKNTPANVGDPGDVGLIPRSGRTPGVGNGNTLQYSCLENPMDRGAWWATVHRVAELDTTEATEHSVDSHQWIWDGIQRIPTLGGWLEMDYPEIVIKA